MHIAFTAFEGHVCGLAMVPLQISTIAYLSAYLIIATEKFTFHFSFHRALGDVYANTWHS